MYNIPYKLLGALLGSLLLLTACHSTLDTDDGGKPGCLQLTLSSMPASTRAVDMEGSLMKNVTIWLADDANKVVARLHENPNTATQQFTIEGIPRGNYTLYAAANYLQPGYTEPDTYGTVGSTIDDEFLKAELPTLADGTVKTFDASSGMPLSLIRPLVIGPGLNEIDAQLIRCVGRYAMKVGNRTNHPLTLSEVTLSRFNPSKSTLFFREHVFPDELTYLSFPNPLADSGGELQVDALSEVQVLDYLIYEGKADTYTVTLRGSIQLSDGAEKSFAATDVKLLFINSYGAAETITDICRNDYIETTVNIFYNADTNDVSFVVDAWNKVEGETSFN